MNSATGSVLQGLSEGAVLPSASRITEGHFLSEGYQALPVCPSANSNMRQVNESLYRPGHALRFSGGFGSHISRQAVHEGGKVVSPTHRPLLPTSKYSWYSFLLEAESTPGS